MEILDLEGTRGASFEQFYLACQLMLMLPCVLMMYFDSGMNFYVISQLSCQDLVGLELPYIFKLQP